MFANFVSSYISMDCDAANRLKFAISSSVLLVLASVVSVAQAADPYASNNGLYPSFDAKNPSTRIWQGGYRTANFDYPDRVPASSWLPKTSGKPLTVATAQAYVEGLKKYVEPSMRGMIEKPDTWNPKQAGWYDMPWQGEGDATGGRESIMGSFSGQILAPGTFKGLNTPLQNFTVVYYDAISASMLKKLWANPFNPNRAQTQFPEGAIVIKAAAVSTTAEEWPVVKDSSIWHVWRPSPVDLSNPAIKDAQPKLLPVRVLQFDIIVKDSKASPKTGWVFSTFVYNADAPGKSTWDKLVPLGAMWGNDPEVASKYPAKLPLKETWINLAGSAPFALEQLGWEGRLSGPIDVAKRHKVIYTDGMLPRPDQRASSCMSCHSTAQYPFVSNLYPSPNRSFPKDGETFLMYPPGTPEWNKWYQNRSGKVAQNKAAGAVGLDYDMLVMFALGAFDAAAGSDRYVQKNRIKVH